MTGRERRELMKRVRSLKAPVWYKNGEGKRTRSTTQEAYNRAIGEALLAIEDYYEEQWD